MDKLRAKIVGFDNGFFKLGVFSCVRNAGTVVLIHKPETFGDLREADPDFPVRFLPV